ncbi:MAG: hypothetical protein P1U40_01430 [Coxiellaceae bacterium]|nr:hypothetical protein [Coxiellaceae bacterium]
MKKMLLMVVLLVVSVVSFAESFDVKWSGALQINSLSDIPQLLKQPPPAPAGEKLSVQMDNGKQKKTVTTCAEYLAATHNDFEPANNAELSFASFYIFYCKPLVMLSKVKPAKVSNIRGFSLWLQYKQLPASVIMPSYTGKGPKGNFGDAYPHAKVEFLKPYSIKLTNEDQVAYVDTLAWGDYQGDGMDDMLISVAHYAKVGTYHAYDLVWLTQRTPSGQITIVPDVSSRSPSRDSKKRN